MAHRITQFNRIYVGELTLGQLIAFATLIDIAERSGYWEGKGSRCTFLKKERKRSGKITFFDSNTGKPLFIAPNGRSFEDFVQESRNHGWPSFRDQEVVWENCRCLPSGETVSVDGTHLGHNLPDHKGGRYCINIVSIAGRPDGIPETKMKSFNAPCILS